MPTASHRPRPDRRDAGHDSPADGSSAGVSAIDSRRGEGYRRDVRHGTVGGTIAGCGHFLFSSGSPPPSKQIIRCGGGRATTPPQRMTTIISQCGGGVNFVRACPVPPPKRHDPHAMLGSAVPVLPHHWSAGYGTFRPRLVRSDHAAHMHVRGSLSTC